MKKGGVYIHVPFCTEKCVYCDFYSLAKHENQIDDFIKSICKEIQLTSENIKIDWDIDTIFIGGGTPSLLKPSDLEKIITSLDKNFSLRGLKEFTIEANPGEFNLEKMYAFKSLGVNRVSFGFQSLHDKILKSLSRWHSSEDCILSFKNARKVGFNNINIDMIFGIPNQTINQWKKDLNHVVKLKPDHISAYSLTVEKKTPLYGHVQSGKIIMPDEKVDFDMYSYTMDILNSGDYIQYEASNYSKRDKICQINLHYWRRSSYLAFGPSAHGFYNNTRYWNVRDLNKYIKMLNKNMLPLDNSENLSNENIFDEIILNSLRTTDGINLNFINTNFSTATYNNLLSKIPEWGKHLYKENGCIKLTKKGYFIADEITLDLMTSYTNY